MAAAANGIVVLDMPVGSSEYIAAWRHDKAKRLCQGMDEVAEHCSEQTVYHMLKSIVSKNKYLVSCLHSKLTGA